MLRPIDLAFTIDIVDASIAEVAARGDGAGLLEPRRKLQAASSDPPPPSPRREIERARIELEREFWGAAIGELLLPAVKDAFVADLHGGVDDQRADEDRDRHARDDHHHHRGVTSDDPWAEAEEDGRVELLDAETSVSTGSGSVAMRMDVAAKEAALKWDTRHDAELARREADREEYQLQLRSRS